MSPATFDKVRMLQSRGKVGKVVRLRLISANKGIWNGKRLIDPLSNGTNIDVGKYPANQLFSIEAVTNSENGPIGSIEFTIKRGSGTGSVTEIRKENAAPYGLCGDVAGSFYNCRILIPTGSRYTVTATPYELPNLKGVTGVTRKILFTMADQTLPPPPVPVPVRQPVVSPTQMPDAPVLSAKWIEVDDDAPLNTRHEACFVMVGRKAYLLGGRAFHPVNIYNPITRKWANGTVPPTSIHHTQCVVVDTSIWIVSSWTGGYPRERNNDLIYVRTLVSLVLNSLMCNSNGALTILLI